MSDIKTNKLIMMCGFHCNNGKDKAKCKMYDLKFYILDFFSNTFYHFINGNDILILYLEQVQTLRKGFSSPKIIP